MVTMQLAGNLENRLNQALGTARNTLSKIEGRCRQSPGRWGDRADQANYAVDLATNMALRESTTRRVHQWERAVARFQAGLYGVCEECNQPIDPARLSFAPDTTRCMSCSRRS